MPNKSLPRRPRNLTDKEWALWVDLFEKWDPKWHLGSYSRKTKRLSEPVKRAVRNLATAAGLVATFPTIRVLERRQCYIYAIRSVQNKRSIRCQKAAS